MRGYPYQRFNDKAAVYYAAELCLIPRWNPYMLYLELRSALYPKRLKIEIRF